MRGGEQVSSVEHVSLRRRLSAAILAGAMTLGILGVTRADATETEPSSSGNVEATFLCEDVSQSGEKELTLKPDVDADVNVVVEYVNPEESPTHQNENSNIMVGADQVQQLFYGNTISNYAEDGTIFVSAKNANNDESMTVNGYPGYAMFIMDCQPNEEETTSTTVHEEETTTTTAYEEETTTTTAHEEETTSTTYVRREFPTTTTTMPEYDHVPEDDVELIPPLVMGTEVQPEQEAASWPRALAHTS